jgi:hypothetical protein
MITKTIIWIVTLMGVIPTILFAYIIIAFSISTLKTSNSLSSSIHHAYYVTLSQSGKQDGAKASIPIWPRLWTAVLGVVGAIFIITSIYFTLHIPFAR